MKLPADANAACTGRALNVVGDAQLVAGVRTQCVPGHQLRRHLVREFAIKSASDIDASEFGVFVVAVVGQLGSLPVQICALGVGL